MWDRIGNTCGVVFMTIPYTLEEGLITGDRVWCTTECPNIHEGHVGSLYCQKCKYFISDDTTLLIIDCLYPDKGVENERD